MTATTADAGTADPSGRDPRRERLTMTTSAREPAGQRPALPGDPSMITSGRVRAAALQSALVALPDRDGELGGDPLATVRELPQAGARLAEVIAALDARYDPALAEEWDAVGLVCGDPQDVVRKVLFAVDPTAAVVDEAIEVGADLLVTHHPLLLSGVHGVPADDPKGRVVHRLIRAGIGLFVAHTNADRAADHGVTDALAAVLGVVGVSPLEPVGAPLTDTMVVFAPVDDADRLVDALSAAGAGVIGDYTHCAWQTTGTGTFIPGEETNPAIGSRGMLEQVPETRLEMVVPRAQREEVVRALHRWHPYEDPGYAFFENSATPSRAGLGRIGRLTAPVTLRQFAERAAAVLPATAGGVRVAGDPNRLVRTVAVCGGSGGSLLDAATAAGADVLLTADLKHHVVSESQESAGPALCEVAHYASEWPWLSVAADVLHRDLGARVAVAVSQRRTDPWTWHVSQAEIPADTAG